MKNLLSIFLVLIVVSVDATAQVPSYVSKNGLQGWWGFNGNPNDESGNGNHGTFKYDVKLVKDRFDSEKCAISLDGNSSYVTTSLNNIDSKSYTISCWFKTANSMNGDVGLVVSRDTLTNVNGLYIQGAVVFRQIASNCDKSYHYNELAYVFNDNKWHHFVSVYDGNAMKNSQMKLYINGIEDTDHGQSNPDIQACISSPFEFGRDPLLGKYFFGELDDIGIWNRALNKSEILDLYYSTSATTISGIDSKSTFLIYPNPTNSYVIIDFGDSPEVSAYSFTITNSLGQEKLTSKFTSRYQQIDISGIGGTGLYIVTIKDGNNTVLENRKLLIQ
jgi:hypothetical protein